MLLVSVATQAAAFGSDPQDSLVFLHLYFKKSNIVCAHLCVFSLCVHFIVIKGQGTLFCGVPSRATPIGCRSSFLFCAILCLQPTTHIVVKSLLLPPGVYARACVLFIVVTLMQGEKQKHD